MTEKQDSKPAIYILDDDTDINQVLKVWLSVTRAEISTFTSPGDFLTALKLKCPDLCIVDLNIGKHDMGFHIIQSIRNVMGSSPPIIILSATSDPKLIAHAIDIGANDYLVKPPEKYLLLDKVSPYIIPAEDQTDIAMRKTIPPEYQNLGLDLNVSLLSVDEAGLKFSSSELIPKGTVITVTAPEIAVLTGSKNSVQVTVLSNAVNVESGMTEIIAEFDHTNDDFLLKVRNWIATQLNT